jgi:hypothetical protein
MISEIDIRDWEKVDVEAARQELVYTQEYYGVGFQHLWDFIDAVELIQKKQVKQVAALFKQ